MVHKYGRHPVGGFLSHPTQDVLTLGVAPAMFMSATHDNDPGHMQVCGERECRKGAEGSPVPCCLWVYHNFVYL